MRLTNRDILEYNQMARARNKNIEQRKQALSPYHAKYVAVGLFSIWSPVPTTEEPIGLPREIAFKIAEDISFKDSVKLISVCKNTYFWSNKCKSENDINKTYQKSAYIPLII